MIDQTFGTWRGAIRLGLSYVEVLPGLTAAKRPDPASVKRLVFVCHGNICRSAFADEVARNLGLNSASFGLSTTTGKGAYPHAAEIAAKLGHDLSAHLTTNVSEYVPQAGDYLLGMEHRHLRKLAQHPNLAEMPRGLLGSYARPPFPHLHDPYKLDPRYMEVCLRRIERAVAQLALSFPAARS